MVNKSIFFLFISFSLSPQEYFEFLSRHALRNSGLRTKGGMILSYKRLLDRGEI